MKSHLVWLVCALVLTEATRTGPSVNRDEQRLGDDRLIQGEWTLDSVGDGIKGDFDWLKEKASGRTIVIQENGVSLKGSDTSFKFKLDASRSPKEIDLKIGSITYLGIYELDEKLLKLCIANRADCPRPMTFGTEEGAKWVSIVLKRDR